MQSSSQGWSDLDSAAEASSGFIFHDSSYLLTALLRPLDYANLKKGHEKTWIKEEN